jgi:DNA-directed RNA polymerase subunit L
MSSKKSKVVAKTVLSKSSKEESKSPKNANSTNKNLVKITNIKIKQVDVDTMNSDYKKCCEFIKIAIKSKNDSNPFAKVDEDEEYKKCFPDGEQYKVQFELHNTNSGFANAINRCMRDELNIYSMTGDENLVDTDDEYVLSDNFIRTVNAIPLRQDVLSTGYKFVIDVKNLTDIDRQIYSSDIILVDPKTKQSKQLYSQNIPLLMLRPYKYLKSKFYVINGINKEDGAAFSTAANIRYGVLDQSPSSSSITTQYKSFLLGYTTYRNSTSDPTFYIKAVCDALINRLNIIKTNIQNLDVKRSLLHTDKLTLEIDNGIYKFNIIDEYWTIANMLSYACFWLDENIPFVAPGLSHPSIEIGIVKIKHENPINHMIKAIDHSIECLNIVRKAF